MCRITWNRDCNAPGCAGEVLADDGRSVLVQTDWDFPGVAESFGWSIQQVQPTERVCNFERFSLTLPTEAVKDCSHSGECDADVDYWKGEIDRPESVTAEALAAELRDYGAWDDDELADDEANWRRIVWIAAGNLREEPQCDHDGTDGTVDCEACGVTASQFIAAAREWLDDNDGAEVEDPGYFDECDE